MLNKPFFDEPEKL